MQISRDPRRAAFSAERRQLLVAGARARGPEPRDGQVVDVVVGEAVARVAVDPAGELVEPAGAAGGEHLGDEGELVALAPQQLLDRVRAADLAAQCRAAPAACPSASKPSGGYSGRGSSRAPALKKWAWTCGPQLMARRMRIGPLRRG